MDDASEYLARRVNSGSFLTGYTLDELKVRAERESIVLPVCSLGTPVRQLAELGSLVLPPLYHEALDADLKDRILTRIHQCFPYFEGTAQRLRGTRPVQVVELPGHDYPASTRAPIVMFSVDTAVEQHGPHLPLATDTLQSYAVLQRLVEESPLCAIGPPVEYGQLTWGLPFGMSVDLTAPLLTRYVTGFVNALLDWLAPRAVYVVDVHGSPVHREAIQAGLQASRCRCHAFRWLHEPLVEFAGERGDQHAGGVETALIHKINPDLLDRRWWPDRIDELVAGQMSMDEAVRLSGNLPEFFSYADANARNGIVGDIRNFFHVDADEMMSRMVGVASRDVDRLAMQLAP